MKVGKYLDGLQDCEVMARVCVREERRGIERICGTLVLRTRETPFPSLILCPMMQWNLRSVASKALQVGCQFANIIQVLITMWQNYWSSFPGRALLHCILYKQVK